MNLDAEILRTELHLAIMKYVYETKELDRKIASSGLFEALGESFLAGMEIYQLTDESAAVALTTTFESVKSNYLNYLKEKK